MGSSPYADGKGQRWKGARDGQDGLSSVHCTPDTETGPDSEAAYSIPTLLERGSSLHF